MGGGGVLKEVYKVKSFRIYLFLSTTKIKSNQKIKGRGLGFEFSFSIFYLDHSFDFIEVVIFFQCQLYNSEPGLMWVLS
jgi:hypothetical protein